MNPTPCRRRLLALIAATLAGCAAAPPPPAPESVRRALAPEGRLRIAVYAGSPTSLVRAAPGPEMRGLTVEVGREAARRLGVPAEFVVVERAAELTQALLAGRADFTITNASSERARVVDFTPPVVRLESGFVAAPGAAFADAAAVDRAGVRIGVAQGSTSQAVLARALKAAQVVPLPSVTAATESLRRGDVDAFASNKGILFEMADRVAGARVLPGRFGVEQLAIGVPQGRREGADWLRDFATDPALAALVREAAARAGLRGLAAEP